MPRPIINFIVTEFQDYRPFFHWLGFTNLKSTLFNLTILPLMLIIVWTINAQGMRSIPVLTTRLHNLALPGASFLSRYTATRKWDIALCLSIIVLFAFWRLSVIVLEMWLLGIHADTNLQPRYRHRHTLFLYVLAALVFFTDVISFYAGISEFGSLAAGGGFVPLVVTIGYISVLISVSYTHLILKNDV